MELTEPFTKHVTRQSKEIKESHFPSKFQSPSLISSNFGLISQARDLVTGDIVALKKVKMENEREGFPLISLREIKTLMQSSHPNIGAN